MSTTTSTKYDDLIARLAGMIESDTVFEPEYKSLLFQLQVALEDAKVINSKLGRVLGVRHRVEVHSRVYEPHQGRCSCNWSGPLRRLKSRAMRDANKHRENPDE